MTDYEKLYHLTTSYWVNSHLTHRSWLRGRMWQTAFRTLRHRRRCVLKSSSELQSANETKLSQTRPNCTFATGSTTTYFSLCQGTIQKNDTSKLLKTLYRDRVLYSLSSRNLWVPACEKVIMTKLSKKSARNDVQIIFELVSKAKQSKPLTNQR